MPTHSHAFPFDYDLISDWNLKDRQNEAVKMREDQDRFVRNVKAIYSNPAGCLETDKSCQKMIDDMFEGSGEDSMGNFARGLMPQLQGENMMWDKMPTVPGVDSKRWKEEQWQIFFVNLVKNIARLLMYGTPMQLFDLESEAVSDEQRLRDYVAEIKSSTASHLRMHGNQRAAATLIAGVPILYAASSVEWAQATQLQIQGWNMDGAGAYATTLAQIGTFAMSTGAMAIAAATYNKPTQAVTLLYGGRAALSGTRAAMKWSSTATNTAITQVGGVGDVVTGNAVDAVHDAITYASSATRFAADATTFGYLPVYHLPLPTWAPMRDILAVAVHATPNPGQYEDVLSIADWIDHERLMFIGLTALTDGVAVAELVDPKNVHMLTPQLPPDLGFAAKVGAATATTVALLRTDEGALYDERIRTTAAHAAAGAFAGGGIRAATHAVGKLHVAMVTFAGTDLQQAIQDYFAVTSDEALPGWDSWKYGAAGVFMFKGPQLMRAMDPGFFGKTAFGINYGDAADIHGERQANVMISALTQAGWFILGSNLAIAALKDLRVIGEGTVNGAQHMQVLKDWAVHKFVAACGATNIAVHAGQYLFVGKEPEDQGVGCFVQIRDVQIPCRRPKDPKDGDECTLRPVWGNETEKEWRQTVYGGMAMVYPDTPLGVSVMSGRTLGGTRVFDRYDKHSTRTFPTTDEEGRDINAPIDPRWVGKTDDEAMPPRDAAAPKVVMVSVTALVWVSFEPEAVSSPTVTVFPSYFGSLVFDHISDMENAQ